MTNQTSLSEAISITEEIISLVEDQNFSRIAVLETKRDPLIKRIFDQPLIEGDRAKVPHLLKLNNQVSARLADYKQSILSQQKQVRRGAKATKAYRNHD